MIVNFILEKETKGALRYQEASVDGKPKGISEGAAIGTLYVRKTAFEGKVPQALVIELKVLT